MESAYLWYNVPPLTQSSIGVPAHGSTHQIYLGLFFTILLVEAQPYVELVDAHLLDQRVCFSPFFFREDPSKGSVV